MFICLLQLFISSTQLLTTALRVFKLFMAKRSDVKATHLLHREGKIMPLIIHSCAQSI